jgi:hypothetical protein
MAMLSRCRRYWFAVVLVVLAVPLCVQAVEPRATISFVEDRLLAEPPNWPKSYHDLTMAAAQLRSFLDDHFGLRDVLITANALVRYSLYSTNNPQVTIGRDRWLFFTGNFNIEQSAGLLIRKSLIEQFADFAAALYAEMRRRNVTFIVASPPNSATIQRKYLPGWAAGVPPLTEYDLILKALAQRGVPAVDLRPALAAEQRRRQTYQRTDTHWNELGALIGYDTVVRALGRSDWAIDPDRVLKGDAERTGGDLARMLGLSGMLSEIYPILDMSSYSPPRLQVKGTDRFTEFATGRPGPIVVVVGDSFTQDFWQNYFSLHVSQLDWIANDSCRFHLSEIEVFHPDIVIFAPTERYSSCAGHPALLRDSAS